MLLWKNRYLDLPSPVSCWSIVSLSHRGWSNRMCTTCLFPCLTNFPIWCLITGAEIIDNNGNYLRCRLAVKARSRNDESTFKERKGEGKWTSMDKDNNSSFFLWAAEHALHKFYICGSAGNVRLAEPNATQWGLLLKSIPSGPRNLSTEKLARRSQAAVLSLVTVTCNQGT